MMKRSHRGQILVATLLAFGACTDQIAEPTAATPDPRADQLILAASGAYEPAGEMHDQMAGLARDVALTLADPSVRARVYRALHESPIREHKLHFRTLLEDDAVGLSTAMTARTGRSKAGQLARLDSIMDLEFYVPVKEHFAAWKGGTDLLVVSYPDDDGTVPRGFDLEGKEVPLSADTPPAQPALVLTHVETNFSDPASRGPAPVGPMRTYENEAVWMSSAWVNDDYEGWGMGDPEFEVHTFIEHADAILYDDICSGDGRPTYYDFDMNNLSWSGNVMLVTHEMLGDEADWQFQWWEDDNTSCASDGRPPKTSSSVISALTSWGSSMVTLYKASGISYITAGLKAVGASYNLVEALQTDDYVGIFDGPINSCYNASGPTGYAIKSSSGSTVGGASVDFTFGDKDPACPLDVSIDGPTTAYVCTEGDPEPLSTWGADVFSGTGTITYEWREDGALNSGSGSTYQLQTTSGGQHRLDLFISRGGENASTHMFVDVQVDAQGHCNM